MKFIRSKFLLVLISFLAFSSTGCSSWRQGLQRTGADWKNSPAQVDCWSGDNLILSFLSEYKPLSEERSDGYTATVRRGWKLDKEGNEITLDPGSLIEYSGNCTQVFVK